MVQATLRNAKRVIEHPRAPCMSGEIYGDSRLRFEDGTRVTTSTIVREFVVDGEQFIETRNSVYRIESWAASTPAMRAGIDLDGAVRAKFNATSERVGLRARLVA